MNFDEASIPILVLERIGITCVSDFFALDESDIDNIMYSIIAEDGSSMGFPCKLPMGYCLRLQLFLCWARQLAVDRGAPLTLQDWWHVNMADFDHYRIHYVHTRSTLPVPNPYRKAGGMHITSTPIEITMSRSPSLTTQPPTVLPELPPSPTSPTAPIGNASFSSSSTAATPTETSVFVNGKWFVLLDDDSPSPCHVLPQEELGIISDDNTLAAMDDGIYGYELTGEFLHSLEGIYRARGAMFKYSGSIVQVKEPCTLHPRVHPHLEVPTDSSDCPDASAAPSTPTTLCLALLGGEIATGCDALTTFRLAEVPSADQASSSETEVPSADQALTPEAPSCVPNVSGI
jgi:hypothetical protein